MFPGSGVGFFWARGGLAALDRACLTSFVQRGVDVSLFSYEPVTGVPAGVRCLDASEVVPASMISRVLHRGHPDLAHFSDLFRYEMIAKRDLVWVDLDVLLIGDRDVSNLENILVNEEQGGMNGAILYVSNPPVIASLQKRMNECLDRDLRWGETGPVLIANAVRSEFPTIKTCESWQFYPVEHYDIWKVLLPEYRDFCAEKCKNALTLHLFNNIIVKLGYWKDIAPPVGSYLYEILEKNDLLELFAGVYPVKVMNAMIENFRFRENGKALGVRSVVREFLPSIARTYHHYRS